MLFEYDRQTDMLYIRLGDAESVESEEVAPGVVVDFDAGGLAVGIEIEDASQRMDLSRLEVVALPLANLIVREKAPSS